MTSTDEPQTPAIEYDPASDAYNTTFDPTKCSANEAVVESVASVLHRDPIQLAPLYEHVDSDALDALIEAAGGKRSPYCSASFRFEGADVTVWADGRIRIEPDDEF